MTTTAGSTYKKNKARIISQPNQNKNPATAPLLTPLNSKNFLRHTLDMTNEKSAINTKTEKDTV